MGESLFFCCFSLSCTPTNHSYEPLALQDSNNMSYRQGTASIEVNPMEEKNTCVYARRRISGPL